MFEPLAHGSDFDSGDLTEVSSHVSSAKAERASPSTFGVVLEQTRLSSGEYDDLSGCDSGHRLSLRLSGDDDADRGREVLEEQCCAGTNEARVESIAGESRCAT